MMFKIRKNIKYFEIIPILLLNTEYSKKNNNLQHLWCIKIKNCFLVNTHKKVLTFYLYQLIFIYLYK